MLPLQSYNFTKHKRFVLNEVFECKSNAFTLFYQIYDKLFFVFTLFLTNLYIMSTINQRIRDIFVHSGEKNVSAFAKTLDIPQSTMSEYINTKKEPKYTALVKIAEKYEDISLDWLFLGKGPMLREHEPEHNVYDINYGNKVEGNGNITGNTAPVHYNTETDEETYNEVVALRNENKELKKKNEDLTTRCLAYADKLAKLL